MNKQVLRILEIYVYIYIYIYIYIYTHESPEDPIVFPDHIIQTFLHPDVVIYSYTTKQVFILELTLPMEDNIVQRHINGENKYAKLLDDPNINQWTGQVFGLETGSIEGMCQNHFVSRCGSLGSGRKSYEDLEGLLP